MYTPVKSYHTYVHTYTSGPLPMCTCLHSTGVVVGEEAAFTGGCSTREGGSYFSTHHTELQREREREREAEREGGRDMTVTPSITCTGLAIERRELR